MLSVRCLEVKIRVEALRERWLSVAGGSEYAC